MSAITGHPAPTVDAPITPATADTPITSTPVASGDSAKTLTVESDTSTQGTQETSSSETFSRPATSPNIFALFALLQDIFGDLNVTSRENQLAQKDIAFDAATLAADEALSGAKKGFALQFAGALATASVGASALGKSVGNTSELSKTLGNQQADLDALGGQIKTLDKRIADTPEGPAKEALKDARAFKQGEFDIVEARVKHTEANLAESALKEFKKDGTLPAEGTPAQTALENSGAFQKLNIEPKDLGNLDSQQLGGLEQSLKSETTAARTNVAATAKSGAAEILQARSGEVQIQQSLGQSVGQGIGSAGTALQGAEQHDADTAQAESDSARSAQDIFAGDAATFLQILQELNQAFTDIDQKQTNVITQATQA